VADPRDADDDESTRIDPPKKKVEADDDDEATKATGTPKMARDTQRILEESRRMNRQPEAGQKPKKKVHPLVAAGVALAILGIVLLVLNWMMASPPGEAGSDQPPKGIHKLMDW
jgi:hypothetical protein